MAIGSRLGSGRSANSVPVSEVAWTECGTVGYEASLCLKEKPKHTAALRMLKKQKKQNRGLCLVTEVHPAAHNNVAYESTVSGFISPRHELNQDFLALCFGVKRETVRIVRLQ